MVSNIALAETFWFLKNLKYHLVSLLYFEKKILKKKDSKTNIYVVADNSRTRKCFPISTSFINCNFITRTFLWTTDQTQVHSRWFWSCLTSKVNSVVCVVWYHYQNLQYSILDDTNVSCNIIKEFLEGQNNWVESFIWVAAILNRWFTRLPELFCILLPWKTTSAYNLSAEELGDQIHAEHARWSITAHST